MNNDLIHVNTLPPFKRMCMTIGELPTSFLESMTYYETLVWLCNYLEKTVIPTINNNGEAVEELQGKYIELKTYVDNYFDNLDVQEEINNKLDDMAEDGILQEIIADYLNSKAIFGFDSVADMKISTNLIDGSYAKTLGYYSKNDGGGSLYKIREITNSDVIDEASIIALSNNTLIAEYIVENNQINVNQFGAKGDGITDDHNALVKCINYLYNNKVSEVDSNLDTNLILSFCDKYYYNGSTIVYNEYLNRIVIEGNNAIIKGYGFEFGEKPAHNIIVNRLNFEGVDTCFKFNTQNRNYQTITFNDCIYRDCSNVFYIDRQSSMVLFNNCQFRNSGKAMYLKNCDKVEIRNCWFQTKNESVADRSVMIEQDGTSEGIIQANGSFFIPQWSGTELAWFKISHSFQAHNCRFSGESPNQMAICYTSPSIETVVSSGHRNIIDICNNPLINSPVAVIVEGLPSSIKYMNNSGNTDKPIIKWSSQVTSESQETKLISKIKEFKIFLSGNDLRVFDNYYGSINIVSQYIPTIPQNMMSFIQRGWKNQNGNIIYTIDSIDNSFPNTTSVAIHIRNINNNYRNNLNLSFILAYKANSSGSYNSETMIQLLTFKQAGSGTLYDIVLENIAGSRTGDLEIKINGTETQLDYNNISDFVINISKISGRSITQLQIMPLSINDILQAGQY